MKTAVVRLTGVSPYSQSRPHRVDKLERETAEDYEARTWKARLHTDSEGFVLLPAMSVKNCLAEAAKYMGLQIPGKGKSTYTKHFESGLLVLESARILGLNDQPINVEDCDRNDGSGSPQLYGDWIFTPSDGVPGSGKRVYKCYPVINPIWTATIEIIIADDIITQSVLEKHLKTAGTLIGLGRWRIRNRGLYGRFKAEILDVSNYVEVA